MNATVNVHVEKKGANNDTKGSKDSFEDLFKKVTNHVATKSQPKQANIKAKPKNKSENFVDESRKSNSSTSSNNTKEVKSTKETPQSTKVEREQTEENVEVTEEKTTENTNEKMMMDLALLFGISKEEMQSTLETLNFDLSDLGVKENCLAVAQSVFQKESPAQLLEIPNMKQIMEQVSSLAAQAMGAPEDATPLVSQETEIQPINRIIKQTNENLIELTKEVNPVTIQMVRPQQEKQEIKIEEPMVQQPTEEAVPTTTIIPVSGTENTKEHMSFFQDAQTEQTADTDLNLWMQNPAIQNEQAFEKVLIQKTVMDTTTQFVDSKNVIEQLVHRLKGEIRGDESIIRITLQPESLGDVHLKITAQNGIVTASFVAENEKIKAVIESNFNQLRDVLQEQGVVVQSLSVSVSQEESRGNQNTSYQGEKSNRRIQSIIGAEMVEDEIPKAIDTLEDTQVNFIA